VACAPAGLLRCSALICTPTDRRALSSFPARRSSDLDVVLPAVQGIGQQLRPEVGQGAVEKGRDLPATLQADGLGRGGRGVLQGLDRKSTRLNSSHVKISYAVFCLKKKIQERHYQHPI